jgi:hypothetical protein
MAGTRRAHRRRRPGPERTPNRRLTFIIRFQEAAVTSIACGGRPRHAARSYAALIGRETGEDKMGVR